ncbi:MAG: MATE family efflux transporter, partial [Spirochaetales bacterium]|nr:MATE family efflux transporter [Candidatus Physcosoma equi]
MKTEKRLTEGPILKTMVLFSIPMILGNMLQQVYTITDTLIVGRYLGSSALASVGSVYTLITFVTSLIIGLTMGCGALFSFDYGKRDNLQLERDTWNSFVLLLVLTTVLEVLVLLFLRVILRLIRTPVELLESSFDYSRILFSGLFFVFLYNYSAYFLRSRGNSTVPLVFLGLSSVLNIGLDILFVPVLERGIQGAAEATFLSQGIAALGISLFVLLQEKKHLPKKETRILSVSLLKNILNYASFTALQQSVMNFGILMIQSLINSYGTVIMASFAAAVKIDTLAYMPSQEFANAYSLFVSQNKGAQEEERIRKGTKGAYLISILFCILVAALVNLFSSSLLALFVDRSETAIIQEGVRYLRIEGTFYWGIGALFLFYAYFRGIGKPSISLVLTIISLGTRVLLAYTLSPFFGTTVIYLAI